MSMALSKERNTVITDVRTYDLRIIRDAAIHVRVTYSVGPNERANRLKSEWLFGTDDEFIEFTGASEDAFIRLFERMMMGKLQSGDPRRALCSELYNNIDQGLAHVDANVPEALRKSVVRIARMYILIFLMMHDYRPHLLSSLNQKWYGCNFLIVTSELLRNEPVIFTTYVKAYLIKALDVKESRILKYIFSEYMVKAGHRHITNLFDRMSFVGCTMSGAVVCECIREFYQGSSDEKFWNMLPNCKCGCDGLCLQLMNTVCIQSNNTLHMYCKITMLIYMSQVHGVPFVNFAPNKETFTIGRFLSTWSDNFVSHMERNINDQLSIMCPKVRRCNDNIANIVSNYIRRCRAIDNVFAEPSRVCLLCVNDFKCALCSA